MMTSNRPLEDWGKRIGDVPSATAMLDRFLHHAEVVTITGRSYRLKGKASMGSMSSRKTLLPASIASTSGSKIQVAESPLRSSRLDKIIPCWS